MATIKDVAKAAGVSVATVSRVLNGEALVAESTKKKVQKAIKQLEYSPNMLGNSLRKSRTQNIMVVINSVSNQFFAKILRGIEAEAKTQGYNVMICMTQADREKEEQYLTLLKTRLVDGVIFLTSTMDGKTITSLGKRFPVVQCSEYVDESKTSSVSIDNEQAGFDATCALIARGHREIAFLSADFSVVSSRHRLAGYRRAHLEHGLQVREENIITDTYSYHSGMRSAEKLMTRQRRPTAVFAVADSIAIGLLRGLYEHGCSVPSDIAVIGFDDIAAAAVYTPSLSTVSQPQIELGKHAMRLLFEKIKDISCDDRKIILEHNLILRETI